MENSKELVKFNRYKSVESFNNATDITSSTISIVKIDENNMDIYLGRTQLTHSNFPESYDELKKIINSLDNKFINLKNEFDSNNINKLKTNILSLSNDIIDIKNNINSLQSEDNHIFEIISIIQNKLNDILNNDIIVSDVEKIKNDIISLYKNYKSLKNDISNISNNISNIETEISERLYITEKDISTIKNNISELETILKNIEITSNNLTSILSDIANIKQNINDISKEFLNKIENNISEIDKLKAKDIMLINDISDIKNDVLSLYIEDRHIFEILTELQSINKSIISDVKLIKVDNNKINNEILSLKEKIKYLSGVDVDNIESFEGINRRLFELENNDKEFQKNIDELKEIIKNNTNIKLKWLIL